MSGGGENAIRSKSAKGCADSPYAARAQCPRRDSARREPDDVGAGVHAEHAVRAGVALAPRTGAEREPVADGDPPHREQRIIDQLRPLASPAQASEVVDRRVGDAALTHGALRADDEPARDVAGVRQRVRQLGGPARLASHAAARVGIVARRPVRCRVIRRPPVVVTGRVGVDAIARDGSAQGEPVPHAPRRAGAPRHVVHPPLQRLLEQILHPLLEGHAGVDPTPVAEREGEDVAEAGGARARPEIRGGRVELEATYDALRHGGAREELREPSVAHDAAGVAAGEREPRGVSCSSAGEGERRASVHARMQQRRFGEWIPSLERAGRAVARRAALERTVRDRCAVGRGAAPLVVVGEVAAELSSRREHSASDSPTVGSATLRRHEDHAGRRAAAEQCRRRGPAQDLDARDVFDRDVVEPRCGGDRVVLLLVDANPVDDQQRRTSRHEGRGTADQHASAIGEPSAAHHHTHRRGASLEQLGQRRRRGAGDLQRVDHGARGADESRRRANARKDGGGIDARLGQYVGGRGRQQCDDEQRARADAPHGEGMCDQGVYA